MQTAATKANLVDYDAGVKVHSTFSSFRNDVVVGHFPSLTKRA